MTALAFAPTLWPRDRVTARQERTPARFSLPFYRGPQGCGMGEYDAETERLNMRALCALQGHSTTIEADLADFLRSECEIAPPVRALFVGALERHGNENGLKLSATGQNKAVALVRRHNLQDRTVEIGRWIEEEITRRNRHGSRQKCVEEASIRFSTSEKTCDAALTYYRRWKLRADKIEAAILASHIPALSDSTATGREAARSLAERMAHRVPKTAKSD